MTKERRESDGPHDPEAAVLPGRPAEAASRGGVALVTGASRGIGRAIAGELAAVGFRVAVHYHRNVEAARETLAALPGGHHVTVGADVGDPGAAAGLVETVVGDLGGLDVLVNNAGVFFEHPLQQVSYDEWQEAWRRTLATNLLGPANLMHAACRHMIETGAGRVINVSSRGAFRGEPEAPAYGASKAGLNALSQSMAKALAPHGVLVFVVAPGWVETDMAAEHLEGPGGQEIRDQSPLARVARPDEIARVVRFLAAEPIGYMTGCVIDVNGASYLRT